MWSLATGLSVCLHFQAGAIALWHTDASVKEEIAHTACLTQPFSGRVREPCACGTRRWSDALQVVVLGWSVWRISEILALVVPTCGDPTWRDTHHLGLPGLCWGGGAGKAGQRLPDQSPA